MGRNSTNNLVSLHPERENEQEKAWERLADEPAKWFMRFQRYCQSGRGRTLEAVLWLERHAPQEIAESQKAPEGPQSENLIERHLDRSLTYVANYRDTTQDELERYNEIKALKIVVPGDWKRASRRWHWVERASAYDDDVRDRTQRNILRYIDHEALYVTKGQRLSALDLLASSLMVTMLNKDFPKDDHKRYLAHMKQIQSILAQIRKEMASVDLTLIGDDDEERT